MRILIVGASGTIGRAVVVALRSGNEIVEASKSKSPVKVDLTRPESIKTMFREVGLVDAIVSAAGGGAWKPLEQLTDADFEFSVHFKLMGQVNIIRYGFETVRDGGSITITSGILARQPMKDSAAVSMINAGLEGFARAAALEAPRGIRVNVVSPPWVSETLKAMGMDPSGGLPATKVALSYVRSVNGSESGAVIEPKG